MKKRLFGLLAAALLMPFVMNAQGKAAINIVSTIDACDSYVWTVNGETYTTDTVVAHRSGDTLYVLDLTINPSYNITVSDAVHGGCTFTWGDSIYTTAGTHTQTFTSSKGCDSTVTISLLLSTSSTQEYTHTACAEYTWHDSTYTQSATIHLNYHENSSNCDSILTLNLTIVAPRQVSSDTSVTACESCMFRFSTGFPARILILSSSTEVSSDTYATPGSVFWPSFHGRTPEQCFDSVRYGHITINSKSYNNVTAVECDRYVLQYGEKEKVYTSSTPADTVVVGTSAVGCDSSVIVHLTINASPKVTISGDLNVVPGSNATLTATSDQSNVSWLWSTGETSETITINNVTSNTDVSASATSKSTGCVGTNMITILSNVGIEEATSTDINIYPNPTTAFINIDCEEAINDVTIFNTLGQRVMNERGLGENCSINVSSLSNGTYSMMIETESGELIVRRFVIAK